MLFEAIRQGIEIEDYIKMMDEAGIDPTKVMTQIRELETAVKDYGFVGAHW